MWAKYTTSNDKYANMVVASIYVRHIHLIHFCMRTILWWNLWIFFLNESLHMLVFFERENHNGSEESHGNFPNIWRSLLKPSECVDYLFTLLPLFVPSLFLKFEHTHAFYLLRFFLFVIKSKIDLRAIYLLG